MVQQTGAFAPPMPDVTAPEVTAPDTAVPEVTAPDVTFLDLMLRRTAAIGASDLHLTVGAPPMARVDGILNPLQLDGVPADALGPLTSRDLEEILRPIFSDEEWYRFQQRHERDLAIEVSGLSRFRVNVFQQRGSMGAVFRAIPTVIPSLESLGAPGVLGDFARLPRGLVLVTGPTGSGKSTTLAAILDEANRTRRAHIVTVEDPIEFVHEHKLCIVNQREVGTDTSDFTTALRQALRQDPDIILVGELRDRETTQVAISAAETGHLVLATLHTQGAAETINRLIDIFAADQQAQIRAQLANTLQAVVSQSLLPRAGGTGRQLVAEVMIATPAIRSLVREGKTHQIATTMQSSADKGMITFDRELAQLVARDAISYRDAFDAAHDQPEFSRLAGKR